MGIISAMINEKNVLEMSLGDTLIWKLQQEEESTELNFVYPFNQTSDKTFDLSRAIVNDSYSFVVDNNTQQLKSDSNYNVNSSKCFAYIAVNVKEGKNITINIDYNVSSESNWDLCCLYYTNTIPTSYPDYSVIKATPFKESFGTRLMFDSGVSAKSAGYVINNTIEGTYYFIYGYTKDSSQNKNNDRFYINSINIKIE